MRTDFKSVAATGYATVALLMVPRVGLEPTRLAALVPKTSVAAITPPGQYWWALKELNFRQPIMSRPH